MAIGSGYDFSEFPVDDAIFVLRREAFCTSSSSWIFFQESFESDSFYLLVGLPAVVSHFL